MHEAIFARYRSLLFTVAYEVLGSAADAEDVVQDSYLRWCEVEPGTVGHPRAYLVRTVTRQALNLLRTQQRRREDYVGTWLPEPVRTEADAGADLLLAESVSMAMLLVLETLGPDERVVFVLREVFGHSHREIAGILGKSEAAIRQIAHRSREHVRARRRRYEPPGDEAAEVVRRFLHAAGTGDVEALLRTLAPDVVEISDGGGQVTAARRPVVGRERVAQFITGVAAKADSALRLEVGSCNGQPAAFFRDGERLDYVLLFDVFDGFIRGLYGVRNPDKLRTVARSRELSRGEESMWKP